MNRMIFDQRAWRWICCVALFSAAMTQVCFALDDDDTPSAAKLEKELRASYQAADYERALKAATKLHEMQPDRTDTMYNIACLNCLMGKKDKAYEWLEKAIDGGYDDAANMRTDYDLRTIRGEDQFRRLLQKIESHHHRGGEATEERPPREETAPRPPRVQSPQRVDRIGDLTQRLIEASGKGEREEALKLAMEAHAIAEKSGAAPQKALTKYNVACMNALMGNTDTALDYLEQAIEVGGFAPDMVGQIEGDSDLDVLRQTSRYKKIIDKARSKGMGGQAKFEWKITLPKGYDSSKKVPLIVALHPYGGNLQETSQRWKKAAEKFGAILLTPQGTHPMSEGAFQWGRDIDVVEVNVLQAIDEVMDEHKIDEDKVVLAGFSQGAWLTWAIGLRNPETFCGLIPVCGNFTEECEADMDEESAGELRVFAMVGADEDDNVMAANRKAEKRLKAAGANIRCEVYDGVGHAYPDNSDEELIKALKHVMGD